MRCASPVVAQLAVDMSMSMWLTGVRRRGLWHVRPMDLLSSIILRDRLVHK
jgi:hypothetical protein